MQKQLNPDIFGIEVSSSAAQSKPSLGLDQLLKIDQKIADLRAALAHLKDSFEGYKKEQSLQWQSLKKNLETLGQSLKILEQNDHSLASQVTQKQGHLAQIRQEMQTWESKLQDMIQKHQMVVRSYDLKIQQLQSVIQQKEQLLLGYQTQLNEAKNEIARLKKA